MYDLRFDCQLYRVKVWPVSADSVRGTQANVTFAMPECKDITVLGDLAPDCPTGGKDANAATTSGLCYGIYIRVN